MSSTFGTLFKVTTFGESHGGRIGCIVDGCPANIPVSIKDIQRELDRRRPGQSHITTPRQETDIVEIHSGIFEGRTTGTPIAMSIPNKDARSSDYKPEHYRPSHADFTYDQKYGHRDWRGGGRSSARETAARVAAGAIAKQVLDHISDIRTIAWVEQIHHIQASTEMLHVTSQEVEQSIVRCPIPSIADEMIAHIEQIRRDGNSVGGLIRCICHNVPVGLGEPVFDKMEADLAKAMMSIPATKGFAVGTGFDSVLMTGAEHNDPFTRHNGKIQTQSNHSGGIQGGISNGMPIWFTVAFKPTSTIFRTQQTVTPSGEESTLQMKGRHDPCVVPRAVPIVEAMANLVLLDHWLRQNVHRMNNIAN